jgi:hypothetical protein
MRKMLIAVLLSIGCYASADYGAYDAPPPPREEIVVARPGFVFVHGHWWRDNGSWRWREGTYVRERPGSVWVEGRWDHRGGHRVWVEGYWRHHG